METVIYLIRHSVRFSNKLIESYNSNQSNLLKNEKVILNVSGERRAEFISKQEELQNIDKVYCSNCVRTLQTAKYLIENQGLKVNIDDRFDERRVGTPNDDEYPDWMTRQFIDPSFGTVGGETQLDVRKRVLEAINEILEKDKGKRITIFTHGYLILFMLMYYGEFKDIHMVNENGFSINIDYKNKNIINGRINSPDVFKLTFNDKNLIDIDHIEFDGLEYEEFIH